VTLNKLEPSTLYSYFREYDALTDAAKGPQPALAPTVTLASVVVGMQGH
jgi:hypothetical protein